MAFAMNQPSLVFGSNMVKSWNKRSVFAPAKVNLTLHILGRQRDGFHDLDSLVVFADIGDQITFEPADEFSFLVDGPFAPSFNAHDLDTSSKSSNLVVRAARNLSAICEKPLDMTITLTKNLPLAAGLGGGSADAAATIHGLSDIWGLPKDALYLPLLLQNLGSDVPVCMRCSPSIMRGRGEILIDAPFLPEIPVVLVNPMKSCPTRAVFLENKNFDERRTDIPDEINDLSVLAQYLKHQTNTLENAAIRLVPEIRNVLTALSHEQGSLLSRLSGSGASCFGLYESEILAQMAAKNIREANPDWWLQAGWLNRIARY